MSTLSRPPLPALRPFVRQLWASDGKAAGAGPGRERMLPGGGMHVVIRLDDTPLRLFAGPDDMQGQTLSGGVLAGLRSTAYEKIADGSLANVGAVLRPGASALITAVPAGELAGRHSRLDELWRPGALEILRERLRAAPDAARRLALFERALLSRLPVLRGIDPRIAALTRRLERGAAVRDLVAESGASHRHFARGFRAAVGVTPRTYGRLARFEKLLAALHGAPARSLAELAAAMGYADQAHMNREFRAFTGLTPGAYRRIAPADSRHVPLDPGQFRSRRGPAGPGRNEA